MKKIIYILSIALTVLTGCAKEGTDNISPDVHEVMIDAIPLWNMSGEQEEENISTRSTATCSRYVLQLYSDDTYTDLVETKTSTNGSFALTLDRNNIYYCLLWADNDASAITYNATNLRAVTLKTGKTVAEAFHGKLTIIGKQASYSVTLNRAVAKVSLKETGKLPKGTVTVKYSQMGFDVAGGTTSGVAADFAQTITIPAEVVGTKDIPVVLNDNQPVYVLTSAVEKLVGFTFQFKSDSEASAEEEFSTVVPIRANYNTNINGHYTSK